MNIADNIIISGGGRSMSKTLPDGIATWQQRMPQPRYEKQCDMNCSPRNHAGCDDCYTAKIDGDPIKARDEEIAALRAALRVNTLAADGAIISCGESAMTELKCSTDITDTGVMQTISMRDEITKRFFNAAAADLDTAIRQKLVDLGWTPPGGHKVEADENAPWLALAHGICTENDIPQGRIEWRLEVLRELLNSTN